MLIRAICDYIAAWNAAPALFEWSATADEILAKVRLTQTSAKDAGQQLVFIKTVRNLFDSFSTQHHEGLFHPIWVTQRT